MKLKIGDIAVVLLSLALAAAVLLIFWRGRAGKGTAVEISVAGQVAELVALPAQRTITLEQEGVVVVIDGYDAYILSSDCPDKHCVKQGRLSQAGAAAICLPNRVVVKIIGQTQPDAVVG